MHHSPDALSSGENRSFWINSLQRPQFETLQQDLQTDILVIGGGIAGLSSAYFLLKSGKQVVVVDDGLIGSGESGRTTAHLTNVLDDRFTELEKTFGQVNTRLAAMSHTMAINAIEKIVQEEQINCHFQRVKGYLFLHPTDNEENLEEEFEALQRAGVAVNRVEEIPGLTDYDGPGLEFPGQAQFHILEYLNGLAQAIIRMGGKIYNQTRAKAIDDEGAECNGFRVKANHIVVATNSPVNNLVAIHTKQFAYRTYVIAARIRKGSLPNALWWDTGNLDSKWVTDPYHYVRTAEYDDLYDLLIVGGEDHKTGQADVEDIAEEDRYKNLIDWTRTHFPQAENVVYQWSGQVMEPLDHLALIGKNPGNENVYIITGDSGNGMTHATIGGILVTDLINGKENPWSELYSPKRIPLGVPKTFFSEFANMVAQYGDYLKAGDIKEADKLGKEEGAILNKGFGKIAVYRDSSGFLHAFSAVCPHLGCVVQWNADEKSFDCPCHGSRFTKEGEVVNGPATENLKPLSTQE